MNVSIQAEGRLMHEEDTPVDNDAGIGRTHGIGEVGVYVAVYECCR